MELLIHCRELAQQYGKVLRCQDILLTTRLKDLHLLLNSQNLGSINEYIDNDKMIYIRTMAMILQTKLWSWTT